MRVPALSVWRIIDRLHLRSAGGHSIGANMDTIDAFPRLATLHPRAGLVGLEFSLRLCSDADRLGIGALSMNLI